MEEQNRKLDEFFRKTLEEHTIAPSNAAKESFLRKAATLKETAKPGRKIYYYLAGIIFLALIGTGIYFIQQRSSLKKLQDRSAISSSEKKNNHETALPLLASTSNALPYSSQLHGKVFLRKPTSVDVNPAEKKMPEVLASSVVTSFLPNTQNLIPNTQNLIPNTQNLIPNTQNIAKSEIRDPDNLSLDIKGKSTLSENSKNWNIDLGVYYTPELMFNTLQGEKFSNNFGIEGTFHLGKFSIRTGAGLSITKGTNELSINYNEYLGKYNKLDSVSFAWDATHTHPIPTFYYTKKDVWDSLTKTTTAEIIKRYTYLQIPLILGYDFWTNDHFSLGLRFGPIFSVLLKTDQLSDNYDPGQDRIIQINVISPDRIETYWQFMGAIDASARLSRRFCMELEPEIRYYYNSVYEKLADKPFSLGLRIAFLIRN
jgi:hypothetical protein